MPSDMRKSHRNKFTIVGKLTTYFLKSTLLPRNTYMRGGLGCIRELVRDTAAATHSLLCGTTDCNEVKSLQDALDLLEGFLRRDTHHDDFEPVSVERSPSS